MTNKLELKSCHEVIDTVDVANIESIFHGKPIDPDILTVVMKDGKRLYCDEVCPIDSMQEEPISKDLEEAAKHYLYSNILYNDVYVGNPTDKDCIEMFKAGYKLGKEQVKVEIQAQSMAFAHGCPKEEPVSEDLKKAAEDYSNNIVGSIGEQTRNAFKAGAQWQKKQMMANTADAMIGLPYENKDGGYTHLIDVSRPLPVGNNKIAIIFKED